MTNQNTPQYPQNIIDQNYIDQNYIETTRTACSHMIDLLTQENDALKNKDIKRVEELTAEKDKLSTQIENMLADVRSWATTASDDAKQDLKTQTASLDALMTDMNKLAQKNLALLEANHTATRTFLNVVREAVRQGTPKAETYSKQGKLDDTQNAPSLMTKSV